MVPTFHKPKCVFALGPQKTLTYTHSISVLAEAVVILPVGWFELSTRSMLVVVVDAVSMRKDFDRVG